jgi:hypothetical protein
MKIPSICLVAFGLTLASAAPALATVEPEQQGARLTTRAGDTMMLAIAAGAKRASSTSSTGTSHSSVTGRGPKR